MRTWNRRKTMVFWTVFSLVLLIAVAVAGSLCSEAARTTDFSRKNLMPCLQYPFGTDWMGRDMFARTLKGLSLWLPSSVRVLRFCSGSAPQRSESARTV